MSVEPIAALEAEAARTEDFLEQLGPVDWHRTTRCPPLNVRQLAVHALRGGRRIVELLNAPAIKDEPQEDGVTYFRYDPAEVSPAVVKRAQEAEKTFGPDIAAEWSSVWADALARARERTEDDPVLLSPSGTIRLREYLRTRCVEVTIHTMDLRDALDLDPDPTPEGLEATCDVLRGLLGADLRPLGVDEVRFALTGTGRGKLTDDERDLLGPLADLFPLLQ